jgi:hypothetical protein
MQFDSLVSSVEKELRASLDTCVTGMVATARTQLEAALAKVAKERAKGLAEVARERAELHREIEAMQTHKEAQEGRVELNIGGRRFETSVQTLRRVPSTFFDAYFSGPVCAGRVCRRQHLRRSRRRALQSRLGVHALRCGVGCGAGGVGAGC